MKYLIISPRGHLRRNAETMLHLQASDLHRIAPNLKDGAALLVSEPWDAVILDMHPPERGATFDRAGCLVWCEEIARACALAGTPLVVVEGPWPYGTKGESLLTELERLRTEHAFHLRSGGKVKHMLADAMAYVHERRGLTE